MMFWWKKNKESDLDEELRSHLAMAVRDRLERGESAAQASQAAHREFGGVELVKETARDAWGGRWSTGFAADVRYGVRVLRKNASFTIVAILTLALGIGANSALFSIVQGVLLNPLPYANPDQLVWLAESKPNFATGSISLPNFRDWHDQNRTFSSMAVTRSFAYNLTGLGDAEQLRAMFVSADFFGVLGVQPSIGRGFAPGDDQIGAAPLVIVSERFWKRKFAGSPDVLTKTLTLNGKSFAVVGVAPAKFDLAFPSFRNLDVYVPIGQWTNPLLPNRDAGLGIHGIGRLKPGVTVAQARADMNALTANLAATYPTTDKGIGAAVVPLKERMVGDVKVFLLVLLAAVGVLLIITCVNIANLTLARSSARAREFAMRAALGAGRGRLLRQLLTESLLLSVAGGGLGLLLAWCGTTFVLSALPISLPRSGEISLDARVLAFTLLLSLASGIFFGLVPAMKSGRAKLQDSLKERSGAGRRNRAQGVFVVVEMSLALVLLVAAGLMVRSLANLWGINPGFDSHRVLAFGVARPPTLQLHSPADVRAAIRQLNNQLGATPGVSASSLSWGAIPMDQDDEELFWIEGQPKPSSENEMSWTLSYVVQEDYLKVMRVPLVRGRFFTSADREDSAHVAVVDELFAHQYFPGQDPVGKHVILKSNGRAEIVGVVGHVKQWGLDSDDTAELRAQLYFPYPQLPDDALDPSFWTGTGALVRFADAAPVREDALRATLKRLGGDYVMYDAQTMDEIIAQSLDTRRLSMILLGAFASLAVILASVGIYGVISYFVSQRTQEIGVRVALGASRADILRLVLATGMKLAFIGVAIGMLAAFGATRLMAEMLYGVSARDPLTFLGVALLLAIVALAACYLPARKALQVDPMVALRYE